MKRKHQWLTAALSALTLLTFASSAAVAQTPRTPREGIEVHGHWLIQVNNPDGTQAARHEFDNSLASDAALALGEILVGMRNVPQFWSITLSDNVCRNAGGVAAPCQITNRSDITTAANGVFPGLLANVYMVSSNIAGLSLSGTATADVAGSITVVQTAFGQLTPNLETKPFTTKALTSGIPVQAGQIMSVAVYITFQ